MCQPTDKKLEDANKKVPSAGDDYEDSLSSSSKSSTTTTTTTNAVMENKKWVLKERPNGIFRAEHDVEMITETIAMSLTADNNNNNNNNNGGTTTTNDNKDVSCCPDDHVIVKVDTLSVDAFIRTMLDEKAYHGSVDIGKTIPAIGYGTVVYAGKDTKRTVGSKVVGMLGAQKYAVVPNAGIAPHITFPFMQPSASLGLMGLTTGLTAYVGCFYVLNKPKRGQTAVVTGAAGAVGSVAVQLLKTTGARVVGIAGGKRKNDFLIQDLGADKAVDYKNSERSLDDQLAEACPDGIDFIYDNVGGQTLDTLLGRINPGGNVVICGAVSQYSGNLNHGKVEGPGNYLKLAEKGATMKGFNVMQYMIKIPLAMLGMFYYFLRGRVTVFEHVENGVENFPTALEKMFKGGHVGKLLVKVDEN